MIFGRYLPVLLILAALAGIGTWALERTAEYAATGEQRWRQQRLQAVLNRVKPAAYTNDPIQETRRIRDRGIIGHEQAVVIYPLRDGQRPIGAVLELEILDAYNGTIKAVVGIDADGIISGVYVLEHRETPGFGDAIEAAKSTWCDRFQRQSLASRSTGDWEVRSAGGGFDAISGATITSRAMVRGVHNALKLFKTYESTILQ